MIEVRRDLYMSEDTESWADFDGTAARICRLLEAFSALVLYQGSMTMDGTEEAKEEFLGHQDGSEATEFLGYLIPFGYVDEMGWESFAGWAHDELSEERLEEIESGEMPTEEERC